MALNSAHILDSMPAAAGTMSWFDGVSRARTAALVNGLQPRGR